MSANLKLFLGADHAGYSVKEKVLELLKLEQPAAQVKDLGCNDESSVHYPDFAALVSTHVVENPHSFGILICGSGIGMAIAANKIAGARAANIWDTTSSRLSREHNDANIICLGARLSGIETLFDCVRTFLKTPFSGGRHAIRVELMRKLEQP